MQLEVLMEIKEQWLIDMATRWCERESYNLIKHNMVDQVLKLKAEKDHKEWIIEFKPIPETKKKCVEIEVVLKDRYGNFIERETWEYYNQAKEGAYENSAN